MAAFEQEILDFDGQNNERVAKLKTALQEVARREKVSLEHWSLVLWTHSTQRRTGRGLMKTLEAIGEGLFCSRSTAARVVRALESWQFVNVEEGKYASGAQAPNEYTILWAGVDAWFDRMLDRCGGRPKGRCQNELGGGQIELGAVQFDTLIRSSCDLLGDEKTTPPLPPPFRGGRASGAVVVVVDQTSATETEAAATAWPLALAKLRSVGYREWGRLIPLALGRQMPEAALVAAVDFYAANSAAWMRSRKLNPGVIRFFVDNWHPGTDPADLNAWPTPDEAWLQRQRQQSLAADQAKEAHAYAIVRQLRTRRPPVPDEHIEAELEKHGLAWPGRNGNVPGNDSSNGGVK